MATYYRSKRNNYAYHVDALNNEYTGEAAPGSSTALPVWSIIKIEYSGDSWITKYPVDPSGVASDSPQFIWDNVETYTYRTLGT